MNHPKWFSPALLTWTKFFVYLLPYGCVLLTRWYMIFVVASIAWGVRKSRTVLEKRCGMAMGAVWLIWGWHVGPWFAYADRGGWPVMLVSAVLYLLIEESDYNRKNQRSPDEWE